MNADRHPPGLWFDRGDAVLARAEDRILLTSPAGHDVAEKLLHGLAGPAGRPDFTRLVEETIQDDAAWRDGGQIPAVVAIGSSSARMAITVTGQAWAEITTASGVWQFEAGPALVLRCVLGSGVVAVRGGLGATRGPGSPDRFARLDAGTVRAGGFTYYPGELGRQQPSTRGGTPAAADAAPAGRPAPERASRTGAPGAKGDARAGAADSGAARRAPAGDAVAPGGEPFEAVLLPGGAGGEAGARPPLPPPAGDRDGQADADAPIISGVYCKNGHFDDPASRFCAVCGISMHQLTLVPRPGRRPPLGVLVLDDGAVLRLDHDYVIGRDPARDAAVVAGHARPLRTADPAGTVSRTHARIELDGWLVRVTDLGSTNGTRIRLPGQDADHTLTPRVPTAILPGSRIDLGGCQIRYESHRGR